MPVTGLTLDLDELRVRVCIELHGTDDYTVLSKLEQINFHNCILSGLRRFYYPPQTQGIHDWTFLKTEFQFQTDAGTADYVMPATFGGVVGPLVHIPQDNIPLSCVKVTPARILQLRQPNLTVTNYPTHYAERARSFGGTKPGTWEIMLWPTPSGAYSFRGVQRVNPLAPSAEHPWLYGGPEHAQTIIEACLAEAEKILSGQAGVHEQAFQERLQASIAMDQSMHAPEKLGFNGDPRHSGGLGDITRGGQFFENYSPVTVSGVSA